MKKGDLIYLPANARVWFRDGQNWVFWETQTPSSAVFLDHCTRYQHGEVPQYTEEHDQYSEAGQLMFHPNPVRMYWDNKFCWVNKDDIYLASKRKKKGASL